MLFVELAGVIFFGILLGSVTSLLQVCHNHSIAAFSTYYTIAVIVKAFNLQAATSITSYC